MLRILRHGLIMWIPFALLCVGAGFGVELVEGSKITTSAYFGFRNIGTGFLLMIWFAAVLVYPISFLPLSLLISKNANRLTARVFIYTLISGFSGLWYFYSAYETYRQQYDLKSTSAVLFFGAAGMLYALLDHYLFNHPKAFRGEKE
ncbi:hypothetical protein [Salibacterium aidingense]|uniref:hypothetical protein n=1 Tax=Salibacterium aidingense TaxID=384933 RepID=UPI003BE365E5